MRILFRMIDSMKRNDLEVYNFIVEIGKKSKEHVNHELQLFYLKDEIQDLLYKEDPESKISEGTKEIFLRTFFLMQDFFSYTLKTKRQQI